MGATDSTDHISAVRTLIAVQRWLGLLKLDSKTGDWRLLRSIYPFVLHLPLTFTLVALMWVELLSSYDFEKVGKMLSMSLTELVLLIKLINIWYRREQAWAFMNELDSCTFYNVRKGEDYQFLERKQTAFMRVFYVYIAGCLGVILFSYVSVLYQDAYELPFAYYVPFDWHNPQGFFYAWVFNVLSMTLCCLSNALMDTMGCYFMFQIGVLYQFLNLRLLELLQVPEHRALPELRDVFQLHKRVRLLTRQCELLVSPYVLSQVVLSALIICFSGYRLVLMGWQQNPGLFLSTIQFVGVMILQIFLPCYYGNQLTMYANQLTNSVFNTNWLEYSAVTRKLLICYMEFLKQPVKVRAGVFFEIGLPIFMKTINNAYSFFALLINLSK